MHKSVHVYVRVCIPFTCIYCTNTGFCIILATGRQSHFQIWKSMFKGTTNHNFYSTAPSHRNGRLGYIHSLHSNTDKVSSLLQVFCKILYPWTWPLLSRYTGTCTCTCCTLLHGMYMYMYMCTYSHQGQGLKCSVAYSEVLIPSVFPLYLVVSWSIAVECRQMETQWMLCSGEHSFILPLSTWHCTCRCIKKGL